MLFQTGVWLVFESARIVKDIEANSERSPCRLSGSSFGRRARARLWLVNPLQTEPRLLESEPSPNRSGSCPSLLQPSLLLRRVRP
jgi:hypothetical protein